MLGFPLRAGRHGAASAAELEDDLPTATDGDVVQAAAAAEHALDGGRLETVAGADRCEERDVGAGGDHGGAVGVAGEREGGVGEQER